MQARAGAMRWMMCLALCIVMGMAMVSCNRAPDEKDAIRQVIVEYNAALSQSYRDLDVSYMKPYATGEQIRRLARLVLQLQEERKRLLIKQEGLSFGEIGLAGDKAEVVTKEKWTFWREGIEDRVAEAHDETEDYEIAYTLVKEEGKWKVDTLKDKRLPAEGTSTGSAQQETSGDGPPRQSGQ